MSLHRLLERQFKRNLGIQPGDESAFAEQLVALADQIAASQPDLAHALKGLPEFFNRVSDSYAQQDRDLTLIRRGLELSSQELTETNQRLQEEANTSSRALHALETAVDTLLKRVGQNENLGRRDLADTAEAVAGLIHEWDEMQQALAKSEERFDLAMKGANDGLWDWDWLANKVYLSPRYAEMLGYQPDELSSSVEKWTASIHPEDADKVLGAVGAYSRRETEAFSITFRCRHKSGDYLWILSRGTAVWDGEGNTVRMVGTHTDVTERVKLEQHLAQFKSAIDQHAIVSITDIAGNITYANSKFCEISGYSRDELIGQNHRLVKSDVHPEHFYADLWQTISSGKVWRSEVCNRRKDGSQYWVLATIAPMLDSDGLPFQYIAIRADITQTKAAEEAMRLAKDAAEANNRAKSEFLANMSHEIRTPMNGVLGMLDLAMDTTLTEEQLDYLKLAHQSADSLLAIINDILDFSKIEAGRLEIQQEPFNLILLTQEVARMFERQGREKGLGFSLDIASDLPDQIVSDPVRIRQILINLLGNAHKFTQQGGVTLSVRKDDGNRIRIGVRDTGIGIPPEKQASVFEAFTQADGSITRKFGGTGLGLTISSKLVRMLGGEMGLTSTPGTGSEFFFSLPLQRANPDQNAPLGQTGRADSSPGRRLRILLAEDNLINQKLAITLLEKSGHAVDPVLDGAAALRALTEKDYDLVLMDMQMPDMDGIEATLRIRAREQETGQPRMPIIALTANAYASDEEKCLNAGMDDFVAKPIRREALLTAIGKVASPS